MRKEEEIVSEAIAEIADFCSRHEWVVEVHRFVRTWKSNKLASWRGQPTEKIEVSICSDRITCASLYHLFGNFQMSELVLQLFILDISR